MSNLQDPLQGYGGLSLFTRTFPSLPDDPLSSHNFLKSLPVQNSEKLVEQVKSILSDGSKLPAVDPAPSKENGEAVGGNHPMENPRERRPGLGRKRARFSLLPSSSQPSVNLERSLDFDKLKDPEEFFKAYERLENAKKEIAKQTGNIQTGINQPGALMASRPHRPGIPGRSRTVKYKHLYPTMQLEESLEAELPNPSTDWVQPEVADKIGTSEEQHKPDNVSSEEAELAVAEAEGSTNKLLDDLGELLSQEGIDEDGAVRLLEDRLQIKPLNISKLNLPELHQKMDLEPSRRRKFDKPRHALSDIHNILRETGRKSPLILKKAATSVLSFSSPTPPKSPFTLVSLLQKLSSQSDPLSDPFAVPDIDSLSERNTCHKRDVSKVGASKEVDPLIIDEDDDTIGGSNSPAVADFSILNDRSTECDKATISSGVEDGPSKFCAEVEGKHGAVHEEGNEKLEESGKATISSGGEERPSKFCAEVEGKNDTVNEEGNENLEESGAAEQLKEMEPVHSAQPSLSDEETIPTGCSNQNERDPCGPEVPEHCEMGGFSEFQSSAPEEDQVNPPDKLHENITLEPSAVGVKEPGKRNTRKRNGCMSKLMTKKQRRTATKPSVVDERFDSNDAPQLNAPDCEKETIQESPVASVDQQTRPKRRPVKGRESRALSRRKSLTGAGSSYSAGGVRRSTRIRSRPLEYWKGERFLYGRIHESLATVIGIKYETPTKDEAKPPRLKVKSYVSDEYKHLVELAALD